MQFFGLRTLGRRIKAIKFMMADKTVSWWKKLIIVLGIVYLFLPIDLIPPMIFPIGFLDDVVIWLLILYGLRHTLDKYWMGEETVDYSEKYKDAIVDDDFVVEEEDTKGKKSKINDQSAEPDKGKKPKSCKKDKSDKDIKSDERGEDNG